MMTVAEMRYWRKSLIDSGRMGVDGDKLKDDIGNEGLLIPASALSSGRLSNVQVEGIIAKKEEEKKAKNPLPKDFKRRISVIAMPLVFCRKAVHGVFSSLRGNSRYPEYIIPLFIPLELQCAASPPDSVCDGECGRCSPAGHEYTLKPGDDEYPWIARSLLDPNDNRHPVIIGCMDDLDDFITKKPISRDDYSSYLAYSHEMFKAVAGSKIDEFTIENYEKTPSVLFIPDSRIGASASLIELIDTVIELKKRKEFDAERTLPDSMAMLPKKKKRPFFKGTDMVGAQAGHLGQMGWEHNLTPSQRESLIHFLDTSDGEITAVNGPPGTGKTTLLQSVIATLAVQHAHERKPPPVIVGCSANNQAVTNIIVSMENIESSRTGTQVDALTERWLPEVKSYGSYCPSLEKKKDAREEGYHLIEQTNAFHDGLAADLREMEESWLDKYAEWYGRRPESLQAGVDILATELDKCVSLNKALCATVQNKTLCHAKNIKKYGSLHRLKASISDLKTNIIPALERDVEMFVDRLFGIGRDRNAFEEYEAGSIHFFWRTLLDAIRNVDLPVFRFILERADRHLAKKNKVFCNKLGLTEKYAIHSFETAAVEALFVNNERGLCESLAKARQNLSSARVKCKEMMEDLSHYNAAKTLLNDARLAMERRYGQRYRRFSDADRTVRHESFNLAMRYYEGMWVIESKNHPLTPSSRGGVSQRPDHQKEKWHRYAHLTPCFVMTAFRVPSEFNGYDGEKRYLFHFIDLLIMDEAGQMPPGIAVPLGYLARRCLAVGDIYQLPPIQELPGGVDRGNLKSSEILGHIRDDSIFDKKYNDLSDRGLTASYGNFMQVAKNACPHDKYADEKGLYLREHWRCVPEIIRYCNELIYRGRLKPKRKSLLADGRLFPAMGYLHTNSKSTKKGTSRDNETDAGIICEWLRKHKREIEDEYGDIENAVAVITPFRAQKATIEQAFGDAGLESVKVGTVHAFQGAERPIIIYSSVCGPNDNTRFVDDENLMNVAVSRAKDSFLLFGNIHAFDHASQSATGLLLRLLLASPDNEMRNL